MASRGFPPPEVASHERKIRSRYRLLRWQPLPTCRHPQDAARPITFYARGGVCWQPYFKRLTFMVTSIFNGNRREDVWLDK
jgi:hypothetical protein